MRNIATVAVHCVVSTEVYPSCSNHRKSVKNPAKVKNNTTSTARIAAVIVRVALVRLAGGVAVDVT
jgi:hypothetical protein